MRPRASCCSQTWTGFARSTGATATRSVTRFCGRSSALPRGSTRAFRVGSDAFALLLEGDAPVLIEKVGRALDRLTVGHPETLNCSFGVTMIPLEASGPAALALAEERLEDQRRRGLVLPDRVGELLLTLMEAHDSTLGRHAREVARIADAVAARLGLSVAERGLVKRTAELHDIGKLALSDAVLTKTGPLDQDEWEEVRRHTVAGEKLLRSFPSLDPVGALVRSTHERYDGSGYPDGLSAARSPSSRGSSRPATLSTRWCRPGPTGPPGRAAKPAPSWRPLPGRSSTPTSSRR